MSTPNLNLKISQWLSKIDIDKERLEPLLHEALAISCKMIKENLRKDHPTWKDRTYALYKAIDSMFVSKLRAQVFIDEETLRHFSNNGSYILNPNDNYKQGQFVGKNKRFPNNPFRNYANYLMEGTSARSSKYAQAMRFVDSSGRIRFVKHPNKVRGHKGDPNWLSRARKRVNYKKIIGQVLDKYGIKHD